MNFFKEDTYDNEERNIVLVIIIKFQYCIDPFFNCHLLWYKIFGMWLWQEKVTWSQMRVNSWQGVFSLF